MTIHYFILAYTDYYDIVFVIRSYDLLIRSNTLKENGSSNVSRNCNGISHGRFCSVKKRIIIDGIAIGTLSRSLLISKFSCFVVCKYTNLVMIHVKKIITFSRTSK